MAVITLFNTAGLPLRVQANNGAQFVLPAADTTMRPGSSTQLSWSDTEQAPDVMAPGPNILAIALGDDPQQSVLTVVIPQNGMWQSVQLYLFFATPMEIGWALLNQGQYVTGSIPMPAQALAMRRPSYLSRVVNAILGR